jgi:hypothetical protein
MKTKIVKIGNSRGIRLPKAILEASGLEGEVELVMQKEGVLIRSARHPRDGWQEQAFGPSYGAHRGHMGSTQEGKMIARPVVDSCANGLELTIVQATSSGVCIGWR